MDFVPSVPLGSHLPPSLQCSHTPDRESARAKPHLGTLQPLCLSGKFTLHWPGLGLPALHYQLLATGTHCSWQSQGKGTPYWNSSSGEKGRAAFSQPGPKTIHAFRCKYKISIFIMDVDDFIIFMHVGGCVCIPWGRDFFIIYGLNILIKYIPNVW